jgi:aryl-phospho-beta-D-glucosidase BglC (GH1 family)
MGTKIYLAFAFLLLIGSAVNAQNGFLKASGKKVVNGNGEEVILRGMGLGGWMLQEGYMLETSDFAGPQYKIMETIEKLVGEQVTNVFYDAWLENYCQKKDIDSMAAWGFNSIRLPMHYNLFTLPIEDEPLAGQDTWLEKGFLMVDDLLEWCGANEIYLILDLHAAPGGQGKDANISDYDPTKPSLWESAENRRKTVALWTKLADRYKDEPWIGGYDLINEPNWDIDNAGNKNGCNCNQNTALWNLYKEIISGIRTVDNNHLVILEGNCWGNNYNGLTNIKLFDSNLMLSFHKYWSYNDAGSISGIINLRNTHNVPIWLGESGENSNNWFTNAISLIESNGIGWAWWPYKKIGSVTGTVTIPKTSGWQNLLNYWKGKGAKPSIEQATTWLMEQAEMMKLENCIIHYDVNDAMFRQINDQSAKPFKQHTVPGTVYAVDYDLGSCNFAYFDTDTADYHVTTNTYTAWNTGHLYRNDGVDIEACTDDAGTNGYSVGWTDAGEWMLYTINIEETAAYSIDFRYAAQDGAGKFHFEMDGLSVTPQITLPSTDGWTTWGTKTISNVVLKKGQHQLKLYIDNAGFNINFFRIHTPTEVGALTPEILNIKTDESGTQLLLTSNQEFDYTSAVVLSDFQLKVNGQVRTITSLSFDDIKPELLVLYVDGSLMSSDMVTLSYTGNNLLSEFNTLYSPFEDREAVNYAPTYLLLPGKFQAENFVYNKGFQLDICTDLGGGQNLGYANAGDYTDYNVYVSENGLYRIDYRVATEASGKAELRLVGDDNVTKIHAVTVPSSGGWQAWKTISAEANLKQGKNKLRFYVVSGEFNVNWISASTITGIEEVISENKPVAVYNYQNHSISIFNNRSANEECSIACYDVSGRKVFRKAIKINKPEVVIPNISLLNGLYLLRFNIGKTGFVQKIRVQ